MVTLVTVLTLPAGLCGLLVALAVLLSAPAGATSRLAALRPSPRALSQWSQWSQWSGWSGWSGWSRSGWRGWLRRGLTRRWPVQREQQATGDAVVELLDALAAELSAGSSAGSALRAACRDVTDAVLTHALAPVDQTVRLGGDPVALFRQASAAPGCVALRWLAAAWQVSAESGSGMGPVVERVASAARAEADHRRQVSAELAAPRATARLLALLPLLGLALGAALGADPVSTLFGSPAGLGCLLLGLALDWAGLRWTDRLARAAEGA